MNSTILRPDSLVKPAGYAEIDWSNELATGLKAAYLINESSEFIWDTVSKQIIKPVGTLIAQQSYISATSGTSNQGWAANTDYGFLSPNAFSLFALASWTTTVKGSILSCGLNGTTGNSIQLVCNNVTAGDLNIYIAQNGSSTNLITTNSSTNGYNNGKLSALVFTSSGSPGTANLYLNGVNIISSPVSSGTSFNKGNFGLCCDGQVGNFYFGFIGKLFTAYAWNRALSASEAQTISAQPYSMIRRPGVIRYANILSNPGGGGESFGQHGLNIFNGMGI